MQEKSICFVGGGSPNFAKMILPWAKELEKRGYAVCFIPPKHSEVERLCAEDIARARMLDITQPLARYTKDEIEQQEFETLGTAWEQVRELDESIERSLMDFVLMDRVLRHKDKSFIENYVCHLMQIIPQFLLKNNVQMVYSGRERIAQALTYLICKKMGIVWLTSFKTRYPTDRFGFQTTFDNSSFLRIQEPQDEHRELAKRHWEMFHRNELQAKFYVSAQTPKDVIKRMPVHLEILLQYLKGQKLDRGNDYTKYTPGHLVRSYCRKKWNLTKINAVNIYDNPKATDDFCLYTLHMQPEITIDVFGSYFSNQYALIEQIARSIPFGHYLYVKVHKSDVEGKTLQYYKNIKNLPNVKLIGPGVNSKELIRKASAVFTVTGTAAFEAGLMGVPAITFAANFFDKLPTVHRCKSPENISVLYRKAQRYYDCQDVERSAVEFLSELIASSFMKRGRKIGPEEMVNAIDYLHQNVFQG